MTLVDQRVERAPDVVLGPGLLRGATVAHMVKNRATGGRFQLGPREFFVLSRLDGRRSLGEIGAEYAATFQRRLGDAAWGQLLGLLAVRHLLAGSPGPRPTPQPAPKGVQRLGLTRGRYVFGDPSAFLARLYRRLGWLYRPVVLVPLLLMAAGMDVYLAGHLSTLWAGVGTAAHQPPLLMLGGILLWAGAAGHELAHGLTCRHYGGDASAIGLRWSGPVIAAFCTVDDVYLFPSRRARVATAASGVVANHVFLLPFFALWLALPAADVTRAAIGAVLLFGLGQALLNYLPVPPLDGYHIVAHLLNVTDLADQSRQYLRQRVAARFGRQPAPAGYPRRIRPVYLAYGVLVTLTSIKRKSKGAPA
jgi:putative peptide zinc metalloprotease protein